MRSSISLSALHVADTAASPLAGSPHFDVYPAAMRRLHWVCAVLLLIALTCGLLLGYHVIDDKSALGEAAMSLHIGAAIMAFLLTLLRIAIRIHSRSRLPSAHRRPAIRLLAKVVHLLLYTAALLLPVTGYAMYLAWGGIPEVFGIELLDFGMAQTGSSPGPVADALWLVHSYGGQAFALLVLAHIIAAVYWSLRTPDAGIRRMLARQALKLPTVHQ
jgi:cytochrome b561